MEIVPKFKKLKQARLSFGQTKKIEENKENFLLSGSKKVDNDDDDVLSSVCNDGLVFKSITQQDCKNISRLHQIQVKVDVHQTIQCPEISTSSIESESGVKKTNEIIDLTEDDVLKNVDDNVEPKMSEETSKNIDAVIDSVIEQGMNDAESLFSKRNAVKENRKRSRTRSPMDQSDQSTEPAIATADQPDGLLVTKKPRRSILEMLSATGSNSLIIKHQEGAGDMEIEDLRNNASTNALSQKTQKVEDKEKHDEPLPVCVDNSSNSEKTTIPTIANNTAETDLINVCMKQHNDIDSASCNQNLETIDICNNNETPLVKNRSPVSATKSKSSSRKSLEAQKRKEEKEKEREDKRRQKEEEKRIKEVEKLEIKRKKEEERILREEEKKKKREESDRLKDEKLKKKHEEMEKKKAEFEAKRMEKERKDEEKKKEREQKEAEKRAKEEEKQKMMREKAKVEEDKKRIAEKQAATFKNFFMLSPRSSVKKTSEKSIGSFVCFQLKEDMFLPPQPDKLSQKLKQVLEKEVNEQTSASNYLKEIKQNNSKRFLPRTIPKRKSKLLSLSEDGIELLCNAEAIKSQLCRAKLLQFSENVRPPYFGTWRKTSKKLNPRNPYQKDESLFDYEIDSDDEWEDVGEGEDIANSDGEDEVNEKEDEEDDGDGFFVPHGYLSDDEGINEDEEDEIREERSDQKLKMKQQEFENSFKQKIKILVPLSIGCAWDDNEDCFSSSNLEILKKYEVMFIQPNPVDLDEKPLLDEKSRSDGKTPSASRKEFPEDAIPDLVRMLHGNPHSSSRLIAEFQEFWKRKNADEDPSAASFPCVSNNSSPISTSNTPQQSPRPTSPYIAGGKGLSKKKIGKKIKEIGVYSRKKNYSKACWLVQDAVFEKYGINPNDYPIPCKWDYITFEPDVKLYPVELTPPSTELTSSCDPTSRSNIQKFATKVSAEDLIEKSKLRLEQDKEKQAQLQSLQKFTTTKIMPEKLLQVSIEKIQSEESKQKRRIPLTTVSLTNPNSVTALADLNDEMVCENVASFGVPTHEAFRSFFKVKEVPKPTVNLNNAPKNNDVEDVTPMEVSNDDDKNNQQQENEDSEEVINIHVHPTSADHQS